MLISFKKLNISQAILSGRSLWLFQNSRVLRFPLPVANVWFSQTNSTIFRWLFREAACAKAFFRRILSYSVWLQRLFFLKFRLRGLGYRFKRITPFLSRFYFTRTNYIYFHHPQDLFLVSRKRKVILLSFNKQLLHLVFSHILRLYKKSPYNKRGFTSPRRFFRRKPGKKIL